MGGPHGMVARSKMTQSYSPSARRIRISYQFPLFNHTLTRPDATGAYLRHAVVGGTSQPLHNCVSAGLRSGTPPRGFPPMQPQRAPSSHRRAQRSVRPTAPHTWLAQHPRPPHHHTPGAASATDGLPRLSSSAATAATNTPPPAETMTGGGHFRYPARGCSRA